MKEFSPLRSRRAVFFTWRKQVGLEAITSSRPRPRVMGWAMILLSFGVLHVETAMGQETEAYFRQNCMSCHTVGGGRLVGPDLKNVSKRKDQEWLIEFVTNPKGLIDAGDAYALAMKDAARGVIMPKIPGLDKAKAAALLELISRESVLEKSQFAGLHITDEPFDASDIARGRDIFTGSLPLENGGASCLSCHHVTDIGLFGGGKLGPDLTRVYERMLGRKNLASWLLSPATATMRPVFQAKPLTSDEIEGLVAYLEDVAKAGGAEDATPSLMLFLLGLAGAVLGLMLVDSIWSYRFRAVRRPLVGEIV